MNEITLTQIELCLARLPTDPAAHDELIAHASDRLRALTQRMLYRDFARLTRWEDADDVYQNAMLRVCRSLKAIVPATARDFLRLATAQIRRELIDLARHHFGPQGPAARHESVDSSAGTPNLVGESPHSTYNPVRLAEWTEFHQAVEKMAPVEREITELLWYQGLTQDEAASLLGVDVRTVKRRWVRAKLTLHGILRDDSTDAVLNESSSMP